MSLYDQIRNMPTSIDRQKLREYADSCSGVHESVLRAFNILSVAKQLLKKNVDPSVVLELIEHMEETPSKEAPHAR